MNTKLFDLASLGGLFLLAMLLPPLASRTLRTVDDVSISLAVGAAAAVGAGIALFSGSYFGSLIDQILRLGFARRAGGRRSRYELEYVLYTTAPEPLRERIAELRSAGQDGLNGAVALAIGVLASRAWFGSPGELGAWVEVTLMVVAAFALVGAAFQVLKARGLLMLFASDEWREPLEPGGD